MSSSMRLIHDGKILHLCKHCQKFFIKLHRRCTASTHGECDCPKCFGTCDCTEEE